MKAGIMSARVFRILRWVIGLLVVGLVLSGVGFVVWANTVPAIMPEAQTALTSTTQVSVTNDGWLAFMPVNNSPRVGYVIYPGGKVPAEAYAPLAQAIAQEGYFVAIVSVPLYLALFNTNAAQPVLAAHPDIEVWAVGGHSLGGVAASQFAKDNPENVKGLILMASQSFPGAGLETATGLEVISLYGTLDGLFTEDSKTASRAELPAATQFIAIEGGNHAQFGWYGSQAGDNTATISYAEQQAQVVSATVALLAQLAPQP